MAPLNPNADAPAAAKAAGLALWPAGKGMAPRCVPANMPATPAGAVTYRSAMPAQRWTHTQPQAKASSHTCPHSVTHTGRGAGRCAPLLLHVLLPALAAFPAKFPAARRASAAPWLSNASFSQPACGGMSSVLGAGGGRCCSVSECCAYCAALAAAAAAAEGGCSRCTRMNPKLCWPSSAVHVCVVALPLLPLLSSCCHAPASPVSAAAVAGCVTGVLRSTGTDAPLQVLACCTGGSIGRVNPAGCCCCWLLAAAAAEQT